ncbi:MAG TPA: aryl-sulfate sulfotransferase [Chthoniobacterales bacterium]|nr:aryl-sulfate sulfotransferase [Chthoniobacterales bacterium]
MVGQSAGPTPFIANLQLSASDPTMVKSVGFTITPKPGSITRPVSVTYTADYLQNRGYFDLQTGAITLPVFGLYANYSNTVTVNSCFFDDSSEQDMVTVSTGVFTDLCGYSDPTVNQARTSDTTLSYDYILLKSNCGNDQSPVIIDTDGTVRWVGTAGLNAYASIFFRNSIYIASPPPSSSNITGITRMELDGTFTFVKDYSDIGVTWSGHHNYDPGKQGILIEVNTSAWTESVIFEIDTSGNILNTWNLAQIISDAMTAGGDDPSQFVHPAPNDWFHNNAASYRASDDSLIVSSRENFVIALDYSTGAIKWILGDPTKQWYQFPSLRRYALTLGTNSLPPIGQHAVSITSDDDLLLFDDGQNSLDHSPPGASRSYSAPRKYQLDLTNNVATEVWNYPNGESLYSGFCSSVYEDGPLNYLIDYAVADGGSTAILIGLNSTGATDFNYQYGAGTACGFAWNAIPIHLENLLFTGPTTTAFQITSITGHQSETQISISFPAVKGNTYRLEYKTNLTDTNWLMLTDYISDCSGLTTLTDSTATGQTHRFYRIRLLTP